MAKLSAHGRQELARIVKRREDHERVLVAMTDCTVLRKTVYLEGGHRRSSTWTVVGKLRLQGGKSPEDIYAAVKRFVARMEKGGYERIK